MFTLNHNGGIAPCIVNVPRHGSYAASTHRRTPLILRHQLPTSQTYRCRSRQGNFHNVNLCTDTALLMFVGERTVKEQYNKLKSIRVIDRERTRS